jgi:hypothetical protein
MKKTSILALLVFACSLVLASRGWAQLPGSLTNGLVGYWALNGNTVDSSTYGNNGAPNDLTLTNDRFGTVNNAYFFNGTSSYINLNNQFQYNFELNDFTLSAWILSGPKQVSESTYVLSKYNAPTPSSYGLGTHNPNGVNAYAVFVANDGAFIWSADTDIQLQNSQWHALTAVFERSGDLSVYVDGTLDYSTDMSFLVGSQSNSTSLIIGGVPDTSLFGPQLFEGAISDVGMWNRALSSTEVSTLYNTQSVPEPSTYALLLLSGAASLWALRRRKS